MIHTQAHSVDFVPSYEYNNNTTIIIIISQHKNIIYLFYTTFDCFSKSNTLGATDDTCIMVMSEQTNSTFRIFSFYDTLHV